MKTCWYVEFRFTTNSPIITQELETGTYLMKLGTQNVFKYVENSYVIVSVTSHKYTLVNSENNTYCINRVNRSATLKEEGNNCPELQTTCINNICSSPSSTKFKITAVGDTYLGVDGKVIECKADKGNDEVVCESKDIVNAVYINSNKADSGTKLTNSIIVCDTSITSGKKCSIQTANIGFYVNGGSDKAIRPLIQCDTTNGCSKLENAPSAGKYLDLALP